MKCDNCGKQAIEIVENYPFYSKALGTISVPNVKFIKCELCGETYLSILEAEKVTNYVRMKEKEAISAIPIDEFVSQNKAATTLGMSKQAFSKNSRIKRGFIYSVQIDRRNFYYSKSVEQFKNTGDGRIRLDVAASDPTVIHTGSSESYWMPFTPSSFDVLMSVFRTKSQEEKGYTWINR